MSATHGHCLCGDIRYSFDPEGVTWRGHCHCESCRRNCSAPLTTFFGVRDTAWRWSGKAAAVYHSSPGVRRYFCGRCGTPVAYASDRHGAETHFYAASLGESSDFKPEGHWFWEERVPWLNVEDSLPKHESGLSATPAAGRKRRKKA